MSPFAEPAENSAPLGWVVLLLALAVSIGAVWLLSGLPILTAAYAGGLMIDHACTLSYSHASFPFHHV